MTHHTYTSPYLYYIPFVILALACTTLSYFTPLLGEDYWHTGGQSMSDSFAHAKFAFLNYNARLGELSSHFIGTNAKLFNLIVTPISSCLIAWLLYRWTLFLKNREKSNSIALATLSCALVGTLCNYFWWYCSNMNWYYPCALALLLLWMMRHCLRASATLNKYQLLTILPLCFLVGWSNEVVSYMVICIFSLSIGYHCFKNRELPALSHILVIVALVTGFLLVIYGALNRADTVTNTDTLSKLLTLFNSSNWILFGILFWRVLAVLGLILICGGKRLWVLVSRKHAFYLLGICFLATMVLLSQAPAWGAPRAYQPLLLIVIFCILYTSALGGALISRKQKLCITALVAFVVTTQWFSVGASTIHSWYFDRQIKAEVKHQRTQGTEHVLITTPIPQPFTFHVAGVRIPNFIVAKAHTTTPIYDDESWCYSFTKKHRLANEEFARMQGVKSITWKPDPSEKNP